jgi:DNA-3-methyladenine glycosylase
VAPAGRRVLTGAFFARPAPEVAPDLLNKLLVAGPCIGRIVEVEAYTEDDPASHSFRGPTPRNRSMFGPAGHWYVYRSYGVHWCCNVVTGGRGAGEAVLLRAVVPLRGLEVMAERRALGRRPHPAGRPARPLHPSELASGPGRLCQAFAIGVEHDGTSVRTGPLRLVDDGVTPPGEAERTPRVGISKATERLWRYTVPHTTSVP